MTNRTDRINEEVKKELSFIIRELKDPRISKLASVVAVNVTKDLKFCKAYISVLGSEKEQKETIDGLKSSAGFVRRALGERVELRLLPEVIFELDRSIAHGAHINEILHQLKQ